MQTTMHMTDPGRRPEAASYKRSARHGHVCRAGAAFARLQIGLHGYEVAEGEDGIGGGGAARTLAFRAAGTAEWTALDRRSTCGWTAIAADILLLDPDVLVDFLQTHAVQIGDAGASPTRLDFDTLGVTWSARLLHDRDGEISVSGGPWHHARLGLRTPDEARARAIMILLAALPDPRAAFEPHVTDWAHRIAQGVQVAPIL